MPRERVRLARVQPIDLPSGKAGELPDDAVEARIAERTAAKKAKNFALADQIRVQLLEQGIILEDTKSGVRWKRK